MWYYSCELPYIVGSDISGIVENVGTEVSRYKVGDAVFGSLEWPKQGSFAQYVETQEKFLAFNMLPLSDAKDALEYEKLGHTKGKNIPTVK